MNKFIPTIRSDRWREISNYEKKGYDFLNKNKYVYIGRIKYLGDNDYTFEVRVNFWDVEFFILRNNGRLYLTIYEIYLLLEKFKKDYQLNVIKDISKFDKLDKYDNLDNYDSFIYKNVPYHFSKIPNLENDNILNSIYRLDAKVKYDELIILIYLIQAKSNYFERLSNSKYINGLIKLLITLLSTNLNNKLLNKLGWEFSEEEDHFIFKNKSIKKLDKNDRARKKYYLTEEEMINIIKLES